MHAKGREQGEGVGGSRMQAPKPKTQTAGFTLDAMHLHLPHS